MKINFFKIAGIAIAITALGLNLQNAMTGYGLKGNKNLNPDVLADGSSGTGTGTGTGTGSSTSSTDKYQIVSSDYKLEQSDEYKNEKGETCRDYKETYKIDCKANGKDNCKPGSVSNSGTLCFKPS